MSIVRLTAKTRKAKNRIQENGDVGPILDVRDSVVFSDEPGPWLAIAAGDPHWRWVHATKDKNFTVEKLE